MNAVRQNSVENNVGVVFFFEKLIFDIGVENKIGSGHIFKYRIIGIRIDVQKIIPFPDGGNFFSGFP